MLQMKVKKGETEEIMDLADIPDFVLMQFCNMIFKHRDVTNPDTRNYLQDIIAALKAKAEKKLPDGTSADDEYYLKKYISEIEGIL